MAEPAVVDVGPALDATTRRALPLIFLGVGSFYVAVLVVTPLLGGDERPSDGLIARWVATAAIGLIGALVLTRWPAPAGWSNHIGGALGVLTMTNSLYLIQFAGPTFLFALIVAVVAFSLFLLSLPWIVALCALAMGGWILLAVQAGGGTEWSPRTINLLAFCLVAIVAQAMRLGMHRRLETLKVRDLQLMAQEGELAREKALSEQRRRIVRMTAHELRTPMTPLLLQAHLLAGTELTAGQRTSVESLQRNLDRLARVIHEVVAAAQADSDAEAFHRGLSEHGDREDADAAATGDQRP